MAGLTLRKSIGFMFAPYYSRFLFGSSLTLLFLQSLVGQIQRAEAINITFDYTYDSNNFFSGTNSSRKSILDQAASYFENFIDDTLPALVPGAGETFTITFTDPRDTTTTISLTDRTINQNEIRIFVGSDELGSNTLGIGGRGGSSRLSFAGSTFTNAYQTRRLEASLWGGSMSFDVEYDSSTAPNGTRWHFGSDETGLDNNEADFLSVAIHEIAHVMGFGTSTNWNNLVSGSNFTGTKSQQIYGGLVPLDGGHWDDDVEIDGLETAMDTTITYGDRKLLTRLDYAGLEDIGWDVNREVYAVPFEFSPSFGIFGVAIIFSTKKAWGWWKSSKQ
ncbi:hypothetical protein STA3757_24630 [Stanieria sp. NIES-3757]|nr:hypothetical protein STA3757_24630 [Stanieria sp. NIES-3757]